MSIRTQQIATVNRGIGAFVGIVKGLLGQAEAKPTGLWAVNDGERGISGPGGSDWTVGSVRSRAGTGSV